jgi:hypothetical protein
MGILVQNNLKNSELQDKITADLREKAQTSSRPEADLVDDSEYTKNLKKTSKFGWFWFALIFLAVVSLVFILFIP